MAFCCLECNMKMYTAHMPLARAAFDILFDNIAMIVAGFLL